MREEFTLEGLIAKLKSGEYDGVDIMHAWMALSDLLVLIKRK